MNNQLSAQIARVQELVNNARKNGHNLTMTKTEKILTISGDVNDKVKIRHANAIVMIDNVCLKLENICFTIKK